MNIILTVSHSVYCCDKTPGPRQLVEEGVCFSSQLSGKYFVVEGSARAGTEDRNLEAGPEGGKKARIPEHLSNGKRAAKDWKRG